jgi:hypothetical protein
MAQPVQTALRRACLMAGLLASLAGAGSARAQESGGQENSFQNILRDVTGDPNPDSPDSGTPPPSSDAPTGPDAAASWESEDAPGPPPSPTPASVPTTPDSPAAPVATESGPALVPAAPDASPSASTSPAPATPGVFNPETGAPVSEIVPLPDPPASFLDRSSVRLQTLDKATARTMTFEARVGATVQFGPIFIKVRACRSPPPEERTESAAFLQIWENDPKSGAARWIFSGWMFASSPALSSMDHPIYDVWVLGCLENAADPASAALPSTAD